jgi:predicted dienelactone hydrolase
MASLSPLRSTYLAGLCAILLTACAGTQATVDSAATDRATFADMGPYEVGVMTLRLQDRSVEIYYPAEKGSSKTLPADVYKQTDPIPSPMLSMLKIPETVDLSQTIPARRDAPAADGERFPVVLFSHGAGGWRGMHGIILSGVASWGFVVASTDYTEYGFSSQFGARPGGDMTRRRESVARAVAATIERLEEESGDPQSRLHSVVDPSRIGAIGHSAGGGTMFGELNNPRIGTIIGWAPVPPQGEITSTTPTMIISGVNDIAIPPATLEAAFSRLNSPKRYVMIDNMGHNAFSDTCLAIRGGNDLVAVAKQIGLPIPERLFALAQDGCSASDLDTRTGWRVIQHFTVAQLRTSLGTDKTPKGLGPNVANAFDGVTLDYRQNAD